MPMIEPASVIWLAPARAMPKSVTFTRAVRVDEHVVRLDVAVDDAVAMREPQRGEDLPRVVDRDRDRRRPARDDQLLQRAAVEVLHRDVVRPLRLAAVVDRDDVRLREPGRVLRLAAEALDELLVGGVAVVEDLDRDAAAELLILREVDVRHPTRAELADDLVAAVEERVDEGVGCHAHRTLGIRLLGQDCLYRAPSRSAPTIWPPKPVCVLDHHGDGHLRLLGGREGDEPRVVAPVDADLGGAGLARDADSRDLRSRRRCRP